MAHTDVPGNRAQPCSDQSGELALHERILRRAYGATGAAALLECVAGELCPHTSYTWAWIADVDEGRRHVKLSVSWPGDNARELLPDVLPAGDGVLKTALGTSPGLYLGEEYGSDHYDKALRGFGVLSHVTLGLGRACGGPRLVTFAGPDALTLDETQTAFWRRLAAPVTCALSLSARQADTPVLPPWAGLDAVEIVDYVCRSVAHDVRNVMSGIIGAIELSRADPARDESAVFGAVERRAVEGVSMADAMREHLRRMASPPQRVLDLKELAEEVAGDVRPVLSPLLGDAVPTIRCEGCPAPAVGNPGELRRAIAAVMFNAVRHAASHGEIVAGTQAKRRRAILDITDNGAGMTPDVLRRAKEPFFSTDPGKHPGLGLTIAEGALRRFGGSVSLKPNEGDGLTVSLVMPLHEKA